MPRRTMDPLLRPLTRRQREIVRVLRAGGTLVDGTPYYRRTASILTPAAGQPPSRHQRVRDRTVVELYIAGWIVPVDPVPRAKVWRLVDPPNPR